MDAASVYTQHVREVMNVAGWSWPEEQVLNSSKLPRFVHTVDDFLREVQLGSHLNEVVVFPDGLRLLEQESALRPEIRQILTESSTRNGYDVLKKFASAGILEHLKGSVRYIASEDPACKQETNAGGKRDGYLDDKWDDLRINCPEHARSSVYLAEVRCSRYSGRAVVPGVQRNRKSTLLTTMRERVHQLGVNVHDMMYWDDYSEGLFISGHGAGFDMHTDCIQTSNIGSVYAGHKLLAIWKYPDDTLNVLKDHYKTNFVAPLLDSQVRALKSACCIALAPPGSVYMFSGANAHVVCNIGLDSFCRPSMCVSSYEAFTNLNLAHASAMVGTHRDDVHFRKCWMSDKRALRDFHKDIAKNVCCMRSRLRDGLVPEPLVDPVQRAISLVLAECSSVRSMVERLESRAFALGDSSSESTSEDCSEASEESTRESDGQQEVPLKKKRRV
eukprot:TRINITY_DN12705_c0_g3_i1.p1 TRINITY_DN12705_c0_g3~~TRINITY_DN12705_c0_g3_i1.p1  ORF type:complete len:445 (-),score=57.24 TRINITY_DN12705_c0_g3_i1:194-1528(-)